MNLLLTQSDYDKAKKELKQLMWKRDNLHGSDSFTQHMKMQCDLLSKILLAYRRQHNIFEVGDWVYPLARILDEHEGIGRFILVEKGELVVVREVKQKGLYVSHENRHDNSFYVYFNEIRHATDEEIAAGRRL